MELIPAGLTSCFSQYFTHSFKGIEELGENEKKLTAGFQEKRLRDFSTGRYCARKALLQIHKEAPDILMGNNSEPLWPGGTVGSISHSEHLTGAIVGRSDTIRSVGLDIETVGGVKEELWEVLFTGEEQKILSAFPTELRLYYATLFFSMKECFYKLQFPITKTFLEFTDVEIVSDRNEFKIQVIHSSPAKDRLPELTTINTIREGNNIITFAVAGLAY